MEIADIAVKDLVPCDKNPRRNDEAAVKAAESIKQFGFKIPLVADRNSPDSPHNKLEQLRSENYPAGA